MFLLNFLADPQLCASGSGVALQFFLTGHDGFSGNDLYLRLITADTNREIGRTGTTLGRIRHANLHDPILQGMECDDGQSAAGIAERIMSTNSKVVSMGFTSRRLQIAAAIFGAYRSSP